MGMPISDWISNNYIELFGAVTGIIYVFLEIRQTIWLWPVGIITSAVYIWVFFASKFYADMSLQWYYLVISCIGWYWWAERKKGRSGDGEMNVTEKGEKDEGEKNELHVTRLKLSTAAILIVVFVFLYAVMRIFLTRLTDSTVPGWDSFITSMSIVATWMLARKIYEHWFIWIVVNAVSACLFLFKGLYPTVILYVVYGIMSFAGLVAWKKTIRQN
jgi:nicotinamide mononucleotide transporter